jgi:hypothetical protein
MERNMWDAMWEYLKSWFNYPGVEGKIILLCAALALVFGIIWLLAYWTPFLKRPGLWPTAIGSALITVVAMTFIYMPLLYLYTQWLDSSFSQGTLNDMMLLWTIPIVLVVALVEEGAKMIPMLFWWAGKYKPNVKMGMLIGAAAGAGFGIFQAFQIQNEVFGSGWSWAQVTAGGITALAPFWEQFWVVAAHIAMSAVVGYGMAKGKGGAFYLLASFLHAVLLYIVMFYAKGLITYNQMEIIVAAAAAVLTLVVLLVRWRRRDEDTPYLPGEPPVEAPKPETPAPDQPTLM